jgi:O-antigen ligase
VVANPITGVGVTNSITAMGEEYGRWRALHNSYLQVALELGLGGLILYLLLLRLIWRNCSLALAQFQVSGDQKAMELLAVCTRVALITYMVAALFLSQAYSLMVPILLLLSEGLVKISSEKGEVI